MQVDLLKAIGLLLIILAHTEPGFFIMQLRVFDVTLMVLMSGYLAQASYARSKSLTGYYKKRVMRLYVPTVLFLTFFFLFFYITITPFPFTLKQVLRSYLLCLSKTIYYVWIIRVFLLCALMVPVLVRWRKYILSKAGIIGLIAIYGVYECVGIRTSHHITLFKEVLSYVVGYGSVLVLGMLLHDLSKKNIYKIVAIFGIIYGAIAMYLYYQNGQYISVQSYKYPPQLYYLSYGIAVSYFLFAITEKIQLKKTYSLVYFLSRYSLSIYLWHIFFLYLVKFYIKTTPPWYTVYIGVIFCSCVTSWVVNKIGNFYRHRFKRVKSSS